MSILKKLLFPAVLGISVLVSCKMEEPDAVSTTIIDFESCQPTRTMLKNDDVIWSAGDRIAVTYCTGTLWQSIMYESEPLEADAEYAGFRVPVTFQSSTAEDDMRFYAVHPSSCVNDGLHTGLPLVDVVLPPDQCPYAGSFDSSADIMSAISDRTYTSIPSGKVPLLWHRAVAHLDLTLPNMRIPDAEHFEKVTVAGDDEAAFSGDAVLNIVTGTVTAGDTAGNRISASAVQKHNDGFRCVLVLFPCLTNSITVTVETDKASYSKTVMGEFSFCQDRLHRLSIDMESAERSEKKDALAEAAVCERVFRLLDLDLPGMEKVKSEYGNGNLYKAATALKEYWKGRTNVTNPDVNLLNVSISDNERNIADQALRENGYRFYVKNYAEGKTADGLSRYYSFMATDGSIDWNVKPTTETQFSLQKHRHQWIEPQAKAYNATGDEKYVEAIVSVYMDWLKTFPCPGSESGGYVLSGADKSGKVWHDLQATSRVQTYLNVLSRCISSDSFTPEFLTHLLASLYDCTECILANPYFKVANNHRLYELDATFEAAVLLPEFKRSESWKASSLESLDEQLVVQFATDGVQNEMDPSYHISVLSLFNHISTIAAVNGFSESLPTTFDSSLTEACHFVRDIVYPDYSVDNFNDTRSSSWTKNVLVRNFKEYSMRFPQDATLEWMATEHKSGSAPSVNYTSYKHSGWYMMRSGWEKKDMMLVLKNNWNKDKWWHCQPDNGTVSLYRNGRKFLPDAGSFTYGGEESDNSARDEFHQTCNHNTLTLDGAMISENNMLGTFVAEAHTEDYDAFSTKNQSYGALRHERTVFYVKNGGFYVIADSGIGSATGEVALHWHFCPGVMDYSSDSDSFSATTTFSDGNNMTFRTFCFDSTKGTVPSKSWTSQTGGTFTSDAIGQKTSRPCCSIACQKSDSGPVRFITVICPVTSATAIPEITAVYSSVTSLKVSVGGRSIVLTIPSA